MEKVEAQRQITSRFIAAGADVEMPTVFQLDVALGLVTVPEDVQDPELVELRTALGLSA